MARKPHRKLGRPKIPMVVEDMGIDGLGKLKPKVVDLEQVLHWIDIGATKAEIAGSFRVSIDTLETRLMDFTGLSFSELKTKLCGAAKIRLRQSQFKLAESNSSMSIWLGKNILGQKDNSSRNDDDLLSIVELIKNTPKEKLKEIIAQQD